MKGYVRICRKVKGLGLRVDRCIIKHRCNVEFHPNNRESNGNENRKWNGNCDDIGS